MRIRFVFAAAVALLMAPAVGSAALCQSLSGPADVSDDFEGINTNMAGGESFTIGTPPGTATFDGQQWAGFAAIGELYASGIRAWMALPNGTGTIDFDPPAAEVIFEARTRSISTAGSVINSFDESDMLIDSVPLPSAMQQFQTVCLTGSIASIDFVNNDGAHMNSLDDIAYIVPEPGAGLAGLAGLLAVLATAAHRRRRSGGA